MKYEYKPPSLDPVLGDAIDGMGTWHHSSTEQVPFDIVAASLSPDGRFLAAVVPLEDDEDRLRLVHIDLADWSLHEIVEEFELGDKFQPEWLPSQGLPHQTAYLLQDDWHRVFLCDCDQHRVLRIIDCRPWPQHPDISRGFDGLWMHFAKDGRAAVMKGDDEYEVHVVTWRSLLEAA